MASLASHLPRGIKQVLREIAPEPCFERRFRERFGSSYLSADLENPEVMLQMDITRMPLGSAQFDVVFCGHVLEHVQDDAQALSELQRILRPGGWAVVTVPLFGDTTFEDPTVKDPRERERLFGQPDHVRNYGLDFVDRAASQGLTVQVIRPDAVASSADRSTMRLGTNETIFFCHKPDPTARTQTAGR